MRSWFQGMTVIIVVCLGTLFGCASTGDTSNKNILSIEKLASYRDSAVVRENIRKKCKLEKRIPKLIQEYTEHHYDDVVLVDEVSPSMKGSVMKLEISEVKGVGGGIFSGPKALTIDGTLWKDGTVIGSFTARRAGIWGGVWSVGTNSCSILVRAAKRIGEDVGVWIETPILNARLGFREDTASRKEKGELAEKDEEEEKDN